MYQRGFLFQFNQLIVPLPKKGPISQSWPIKVHKDSSLNPPRRVPQAYRSKVHHFTHEKGYHHQVYRFHGFTFTQEIQTYERAPFLSFADSSLGLEFLFQHLQKGHHFLVLPISHIHAFKTLSNKEGHFSLPTKSQHFHLRILHNPTSFHIYIMRNHTLTHNAIHFTQDHHKIT